MRTLLLALAAVAVFSSPSLAQGELKNALLLEVGGPALGVYSAQYERLLGNGTSALIGVSHFDLFNEAEFLSVSGKARYYLNGSAYDRFSITLSAGIWKGTSTGESCGIYSCADSSVSEIAPTAGAELAYTWLLTKSKRLSVTPMVGAKRVFADRFIARTFSAPLPVAGVFVGVNF